MDHCRDDGREKTSSPYAGFAWCFGLAPHPGACKTERSTVFMFHKPLHTAKEMDPTLPEGKPTWPCRISERQISELHASLVPGRGRMITPGHGPDIPARNDTPRRGGHISSRVMRCVLACCNPDHLVSVDGNACERVECCSDILLLATNEPIQQHPHHHHHHHQLQVEQHAEKLAVSDCWSTQRRSQRESFHNIQALTNPSNAEMVF